MKKYKLDDMKKGWFVGNFEPTVLKTPEVEVAYRGFKAGATEPRHVHHIATELTVIVAGEVKMNGQKCVTGDIVRLEPGEAADFEALTDGAVVVVKTPSVPGDKYLVFTSETVLQEKVKQPVVTK